MILLVTIKATLAMLITQGWFRDGLDDIQQWLDVGVSKLWKDSRVVKLPISSTFFVFKTYESLCQKQFVEKEFNGFNTIDSNRLRLQNQVQFSIAQLSSSPFRIGPTDQLANQLPFGTW